MNINVLRPLRRISGRESDGSVMRELPLRAVVARGDDCLAASTVLRIMKKIEAAERAEWANFLRGDRQHYADLRANELSILKRILSGSMDAAEVAPRLDGWTDWLQLRIAGTTTNVDVLDTLAAVGRTRRIRDTARERRGWVRCRHH